MLDKPSPDEQIFLLQPFSTQKSGPLYCRETIKHRDASWGVEVGHVLQFRRRILSFFEQGRVCPSQLPSHNRRKNLEARCWKSVSFFVRGEGEKYRFPLSGEMRFSRVSQREGFSAHFMQSRDSSGVPLSRYYLPTITC